MTITTHSVGLSRVLLSLITNWQYQIFFVTPLLHVDAWLPPLPVFHAGASPPPTFLWPEADGISSRHADLEGKTFSLSGNAMSYSRWSWSSASLLFLVFPPLFFFPAYLRGASFAMAIAVASSRVSLFSRSVGSTSVSSSSPWQSHDPPLDSYRN